MNMNDSERVLEELQVTGESLPSPLLLNSFDPCSHCCASRMFHFPFSASHWGTRAFIPVCLALLCEAL